MERQLYCGTAKQCITPCDALLTDLSGLMNQSFGGILNPIYLRVLALKNRGAVMVFVSFELDKVPQPKEYLEELIKIFGLKEEYIFLTAVHTHSAPIAGKRPFEGPNNIAGKSLRIQNATAAYEKFLTEKLVEAVREALEHLIPAKMGFVSAESHINAKRNQWYEYTDEKGEKHRKLALGLDLSSPVDHTLFAAKFEDLEGKPLAFWINYPVHCCVLHANKCCNGKLGISGDLAGMVSWYMEEEYPDTVSLWCSGAAGDLNPLMMNELYYPDPKSGEAVTFQMPKGDCIHLLQFLAANHFRDIMGAVSGIKCEISDPGIQGRVEWSRTSGVEEEYEVRLHMVRLDELVLIGASGELYSTYGELARKLLPRQHVILINHDASLCAHSGYILDDETLLLPEVDLPGTEKINMIPGNFTKSFAEHVLHMYRSMSDEERNDHI